MLLAGGHIQARGTAADVLPMLMRTGSTMNYCEGKVVEKK